MINTLKEILRNDANISVTFGTSILPGQEIVAMLMTKGAGGMITGRGADPDAALSDLVGKMRPAPQPQLPGME